MLEDFRLKVFVAVAQSRSFTKAAAQLSISQPAVSQHISELEKTTGMKLFQRLRGETIMTDAGALFHQYAKDILAKYDQMEQMFLRFPILQHRTSRDGKHPEEQLFLRMLLRITSLTEIRPLLLGLLIRIRRQ